MENKPIGRKELEAKLAEQLNIRAALSDLRDAITAVCSLENRFQERRPITSCSCAETRKKARDIHKALGALFTELMARDTIQSIIIGNEEVFIYPTVPLVDDREGDDIDL